MRSETVQRVQYGSTRILDQFTVEVRISILKNQKNLFSPLTILFLAKLRRITNVSGANVRPGIL